MSDADARLERLERLTRLRDSGALSAEEFAVEKRRVLMGEAPAAPPLPPPPPPPSPPVPPREVVVEPEPYEEEAPEPRRRLPVGKLVAGVAIASAVGALAFINTTPSEVPGRSAPKAATKPREAATPASVTPVAPKTADLSNTLRFDDASQCAFSPSSDTLFEKLLPESAEGGPAPSPERLAVGDFDLLVATDKDAVGPAESGGQLLKAWVRLPEQVRWNGLKLSRVVREYLDYPESDDTDTRMMTFLNPAADVQAALKLKGVTVPIAPQSRELDDSGGSCGGTMQVLPVTGGSALVCSWGC